MKVVINSLKSPSSSPYSPVTLLMPLDSIERTEKLEAYIDSMEQTIQRLLEKHAFSPTALAQQPLIDWEMPEKAPGGACFYLIAKSIKNHDITQFFLEMIGHWLLPGKQIQILSTRFLPFKFDSFSESFIMAEITAYLEDDNSLHLAKKNIPQIAQEIAIGALTVLNARHILATKGMTLDQKATQIHKMIVHFTKNRLKPVAAELFSEMQYLLLACDDEFKRIRDIKHFIRLICYSNWFRKSLRSAKKEISDQRKIIFKLFRSELRFAFGKRNVIGIVIAINFIKEYERFDEKHILKACQNVVSQIKIVPHSFFSYTNATDSVRTFYVEIEKKDGQAISQDELRNLQKNLEDELITSIEQLSHRLFMPHNEEEVMRNILLLSRELRYVRDVPQVIISFQSQTETTITFLIILVRILKTQDTPALESLFKNRSEIIRFVQGSKKVVGKLRKKYPKEANTFLLECQKSPFLRQDHSVDLSRARQFVTSNISEVLGEVRDFNGGLILQQNQQLVSLKSLLSSQELKYELHLENLYHAITPILMKSLVAPELIKALFQLFLKLHLTVHSKAGIEWMEHPSERALTVMVRLKDCPSCDQVENAIEEINLKELELASTSFRVDGIRYRGYIVLSEDTEKPQHFLKLLRERIAASDVGHIQIMKISLPRPTSLLDPRIGTDRTSGIVIKMLYDGLMRIDATGKAVYAIAKDVAISEDKKCYTFHLRHAKWSNSKPVTAHDFAYAWKKILDPSFTSLFAYLFYPIKNAQAIKKGKLPIDEVGINVINDTTLEVLLEHPSPYFLELTSHWAYSPLCKEVDELHPGWAYYGGDTYVCNGPFRLAKWRRNTEIQAVKNKEYWDKNSVHLDQIDISVVENPKTALSLYEKGELDWIGEPLSEIPPDAFKKKNFDGKIHSHPISAVHWYGCNVEALPLSTPKLRRALAMAIDRKAIIKELLHESDSPAFSILPPNLSLASDPFFSDGNLDEAKKIFEEGLNEVGLTRAQIPKLSITCSDQELHRSIAVLVGKQWKEVLGIDLKIETFKWERYMEKCLQHDFQLMAMTWYSWYNDPIYNLEQVKYKTSDMNMTQWENSRYIQLLDKAQESLDPKQRFTILKDAEAIVMEEMPIIPLFCYTFRYMKKEKVENIFLSHLGQIDFKWAHVLKTDKKSL